MARVRVIRDREGQTLTVWFSDPTAEFVCEEVGRGIVVIKARSGQVIGIERLYFTAATVNCVVETPDG